MIIPAFFANFSIFIENPQRRSELTLFNLPSVIITIHNMIKNRGVKLSLPYGEVPIFLLGLSALMSTYQVHPTGIRKSYHSLLKIVFGDN